MEDNPVNINASRSDIFVSKLPEAIKGGKMCPKWLVTKTLTTLGAIDKQVERGKIGEREHNKRSRQAIEKALSIQNRITLKYKRKRKK